MNVNVFICYAIERARCWRISKKDRPMSNMIRVFFLFIICFIATTMLSGCIAPYYYGTYYPGYSAALAGGAPVKGYPAYTSPVVPSLTYYTPVIVMPTNERPVISMPGFNIPLE